MTKPGRNGADRLARDRPPEEHEGPAETETREQLDLRRAFEARLTGTPDRALFREHIERARAQRERARSGGPLLPADAGAPARSTAHLVGDDGDVLDVSRGHHPGGPPMFSEVLALAEVRADRPIAGVLRLPVEAAAASRIVPGSLRLARWDPAAKRFRLLPGSALRPDGSYVHGHVTRPGIYGAIGLPASDAVLTTLEVMRSVGDLLGPGGSSTFLPKVCQLILCAGPGTGPGGPGDLCAKCLGGAGLGVDLDLFNSIDLVPGITVFDRPVPLPRRCEAWESAGPIDVPGRMTALAVHPQDGKVLYAGSASGGVFKTTDRGGTWSALWHDQLSLAVGGLAIAPSRPQVVYAATGEWTGPLAAPNNHFSGVGVYRTIDGGGDWDLLAPIPSTETSAVAVDPSDADTAYVAGNMALHRTRDGGRTWDLAGGNTKGVFDGLITDVVVDPNDPMRVYIGVHNDGVWRSTNGGASWAKLTLGIASGAAAVSPKIALGRAGPNGSQFVAVLMALKVYTSTNGGTSFTKKTDLPPAMSFGSDPAWCSVIAVDPTSEDVLLAGHVYLARSTDGGVTWTLVAGGYLTLPLPAPYSNVHVDMQAVVFDPKDHDRVFVASDGGVSTSVNNGQTWALCSFGLVTTQCWTVAASQASGGRIAITTQDNFCYGSIPGSYGFQQILPWEGGIVEFDPTDPLVLYANTCCDLLKRSADGGATWKVINNAPDLTEALAISHQAGDLLLAVRWPGGGTGWPPAISWLERTDDGGTTWSVVIPMSLAGPSAVAFAPSNDQIAYAGAISAGVYRVFRSTDAGQTWTALATGALPNAWITRIVVDPLDPKRFYVAFGGLGLRHLWRGEIGATATAVTWTDVSGRLPAVSLPDLAVTGIVLHPTFDETMYVSNILGVYRTLDGGESWAAHDEGLPNSFVSDLDLRRLSAGGILFASTMGRGVYRRRI